MVGTLLVVGSVSASIGLGLVLAKALISAMLSVLSLKTPPSSGPAAPGT